MQTLITVLHNFGAIFTLLFGIWGIFQPQKAAAFVSFIPKGKRGISEVRATYGGWLVGLGTFALWQQNDLVFQMLGAAWCGAAMMRGLSIFMDKSNSATNWKLFVGEVIIGIGLLL